MAFSMAVTGLTLAMLATTLATTIELGNTSWQLQQQLLNRRHVEHLLSTSISRAGRGFEGASALTIATSTVLVLRADLNGDGRIDDRSAETSSFELERGSGATRLLHRMGRQSMTLARGLPEDAAFVLLTDHGQPATSAASVAVVVLEAGNWTSTHAIGRR